MLEPTPLPCPALAKQVFGGSADNLTVAELRTQHSLCPQCRGTGFLSGEAEFVQRYIQKVSKIPTVSRVTTSVRATASVGEKLTVRTVLSEEPSYSLKQRLYAAEAQTLREFPEMHVDFSWLYTTTIPLLPDERVVYEREPMKRGV